MNENTDRPAVEAEQANTVPNEAVPAAMDALSERVRELEARERALALRERESRCRQAMKDKALPDTLFGCLDLSSDERAGETLTLLADAFNTAVSERVRARLGAEPPRAAHSTEDDTFAAIAAAMGIKKE